MAIDIEITCSYTIKQAISIIEDNFNLIEINQDYSSLTIIWKSKYIWVFFYQDDNAGSLISLENDTSKINIMLEFSHDFIYTAENNEHMHSFLQQFKQLGFNPI